MQKCKKCLRPCKYLLSHLKGTCKIAYRKEEIEELRKKARQETHKKAYLRRYSPAIRHQKYVSSKLKSNTPKPVPSDILVTPKDPQHKIHPLKMTLKMYTIHKGFQNMFNLINKEIIRNNLSKVKKGEIKNQINFK